MREGGEEKEREGKVNDTRNEREKKDRNGDYEANKERKEEKWKTEKDLTRTKRERDRGDRGKKDQRECIPLLLTNKGSRISPQKNRKQNPCPFFPLPELLLQVTGRKKET